MNYRTPILQEAEPLWQLMNQLDHETKYMLYEPGERSKNIPRMEALIKGAQEQGSFLMVAEADQKLVGFLSAQRGGLRRTAHCAYIVVGILKDYRGKGVGTELFRLLELWAEEARVSRLELTVVCENEIAKHLYEKNGFEVEGIKRNSLWIDGRFVDEYYMAKIRQG